GNDMYHAVGLGAMNLHGYFAKNHIYYGSPESIEFTDIYFMLLNYWTLVESNKIAIERNETFHEFELSEYADGTYFDKYLPKINGYGGNNVNEFVFKNERVKELFQGIFIPTLEDWHKLRTLIMEHGLY